MTTPEREQAASVWPALMAIGAVVICCAGLVLIAVLAATGVAAAVVRSAAPVATGLGFITVLAIAGFAWRRRRVCACLDAPVPSQRGAVRSADERTADPRSHLTHVPDVSAVRRSTPDLSGQLYKNLGSAGPPVADFASAFARAGHSSPNWVWGEASQEASYAYDPKGYPDVYFLISKDGVIRTISSAPNVTMDQILSFAWQAR